MPFESDEDPTPAMRPRPDPNFPINTPLERIPIFCPRRFGNLERLAFEDLERRFVARMERARIAEERRRLHTINDG
jgi:hypothetical protein